MTNITTMERPPSPMTVIRREIAEMKSEFLSALPKQIPIDRFCRVVLTAIQNNPDLLNVERRSLWNAAMRAAQDGLLPDGREGAMVVYKSKEGRPKAQWIPMIGGLRKKVRNSGEIATWDAHVVHEHDHFEFALGDKPYIIHKPVMINAGKPIAAYSVATLKSGEISREVMTIAEIEAIRERSRAKEAGPWKTDYEEMMRKTVARRHSKVLPMSTDLDDLIRRDDDDDEDEREDRRQAATGANALDVFAASDEPDPEDQKTDALISDLAIADAHARGMEARHAKRAMQAVPPDWRDDEHKPLADAWISGWKMADEELSAERR